MTDGSNNINEINNIIKMFHMCTLEAKCAILSNMLANLKEHSEKVGIDYSMLVNEIIKSTQGEKDVNRTTKHKI